VELRRRCSGVVVAIALRQRRGGGDGFAIFSAAAAAAADVVDNCYLPKHILLFIKNIGRFVFS